MASQPAYARIHEQIASRISNGMISENERLPTEREMCDEFGVSRITIRHALTLLGRDGLIRKRQGQGIFVCPRRYEHSLDSMYTFADELRKQNAQPSWKVLSMEPQDMDGDIANRLGLCERSQCRCIRRLSYADGRLLSYEQIYVPEALMQGATAEDVERDGLYTTIQRVSGLHADRAQEIFEAVLAPGEVCQALERKQPLAVTKLVRTTFAGEHPLHYSVRYVLGDKYRFKLNYQK